MNAGRKILTNYRLNDLVTRLRYTASELRGGGYEVRLDAADMEELADLLEGMIQSPTEGSAGND